MPRNFRSRAIAAVGAMPFPGRHFVSHCYRQGIVAGIKGDRLQVEGAADALHDFAQAHVTPAQRIAAGSILNFAAVAMEASSAPVNTVAGLFTGVAALATAGTVYTQRYLRDCLQARAEKMPEIVVTPELSDSNTDSATSISAAVSEPLRPSNMDAKTPSLFEYAVADLGTQAALFCSAIGGASLMYEVAERVTNR